MPQLITNGELVLGGEDSQRVSDDLVLINSGNATRNWAETESGEYKLYRLVPDGMRLDGFNKNNMMLWMHNMNLPLGRMELFKQGGMLWGHKFSFHRKKLPIATQNWIGDAIGEFDTSVIADLWHDGFLRATSIHVIFQPEDVQNIYETATEIVFATSEVIEASIVTIPGDRDSVKERMLTLGLPKSVVGNLTNDEFLLNDAKKLYVPVNTVPTNKPEKVEVNEMAGLADLNGKTESAALEEFDEVEETEIELEFEEVELGEEELVSIAQQLALSPVFVNAFAEALLKSPAAESLVSRLSEQLNVKQPTSRVLKLRVGSPAPQAPAQPFTVKTVSQKPAAIDPVETARPVSRYSKMVRN